MRADPPLRLAREDDLDALPDIELSAGRLFVAHGFGDAAYASPAEAWRPSLEAGLLWVAEADGAAVAFLAAKRLEDCLYIAEVDVAFEYQRRGLGRALVTHAVEVARYEGLVAVALTTAKTPPWNAPAYLRMGFENCSNPPPWLAEIWEAEVRSGQPDRCAILLRLAG